MLASAWPERESDRQTAGGHWDIPIHGVHCTFSTAECDAAKHIHCLLSGLVARCLRLLHSGVLPQRAGGTIPSQGFYDQRGNFSDLGDAAFGRISVRKDGGPV